MIIEVKVKPKASKDALFVKNETLNIWVKEPPEDGKANQGVIRQLAKFLKVDKRQLRLVSGKKSRIKMIDIADADAEWFDSFIEVLRNEGKTDA